MKSQVKYKARGAFLAGSLVNNGWASIALCIVSALLKPMKPLNGARKDFDTLNESVEFPLEYVDLGDLDLGAPNSSARHGYVLVNEQISSGWSVGLKGTGNRSCL